MSRREPANPKAWANFLVRAWGPHFPVDVRTIALDYTKRYEDPIAEIAVAKVETFEGALYPLTKRKGWVILYNPNIPVFGRINFTLGHEFGHYLNHRTRVEHFECSQQQILGYERNASLRQLEVEADEFASYLLMPMDDFRAQVRGQKMTLDLLGGCAERYGVSWTAAARKWIEFTEERAVLVVGRDGFVLWSRASDSAYRSGVFYKKGTPLPDASIAAQRNRAAAAEASGTELPPGTWRADEPVREMTIFADRYDLTISLLLLLRDAPAMRGSRSDEDSEPAEDVYDRMTRGC